MLRKKAIEDFITVCREKDWNKAVVLDQIYCFVTDTFSETNIRLQDVEILEEGEVVD
ncbi:hypothetical protein LCGC14_2363460 [marine sediment metagenome]|uniref:Uncharacterized protein n=1 Tax=marine sediment metagenome TaxID=412755 RepID=A0A0F9F0N2_9ZZZZ